MTVRTPDQRAADFLRHVRHDYYSYTYASCRTCGHSEIAHNRAGGCEGVDEQGAPCECRR